jgi:hypothetical protein
MAELWFFVWTVDLLERISDTAEAAPVRLYDCGF